MIVEQIEVNPEYTEFDSEYLFKAEFASCHVFRTILECLNTTMSTLPIYFGKDEISIVCVNGFKTMFFQGIIETCNLTDYYLSPIVTKEDDSAVHIIHVDVGRLLKSVKDLPRKGLFQISQSIKDPENIMLTILVDGQSTSSSFRLLPVRDEDSHISFQEADPMKSAYPNKTVLLSKFTQVASSAGKSTSKSSYLRCYPNGVDIAGMSSDKGSQTYTPWGECDVDPICEIKVGVEIMKSMAKLSNLCTEGIIRFYCNDPGYIRLEIPLSILGIAYIYIKKNSSDDK